MKVNIINGLLQTSLSITYQGQTKIIDRLIVDTGAARTLISSDAVFDLGIFFTGEEINTMYGVGGKEHSFRKVVDQIRFSKFEAENFNLDFGNIDESYGINGILGLDILIIGGFVIDLVDMKVYQK